MDQMDHYTSKDIGDLRDLVTGLIDRYRVNNERLDVLNRTEQDLLHEIEFVPMDMRKMVDFCKRLRDCRQERRECKNENEIIDQARGVLVKYHGLPRELDNALCTAQYKEEQQSRRVYTLRAGAGTIGETAEVEAI